MPLSGIVCQACDKVQGGIEDEAVCAKQPSKQRGPVVETGRKTLVQTDLDSFAGILYGLRMHSMLPCRLDVWRSWENSG